MQIDNTVLPVFPKPSVTVKHSFNISQEFISPDRQTIPLLICTYFLKNQV